jgi:hypothetical protein
MIRIQILRNFVPQNPYSLIGDVYGCQRKRGPKILFNDRFPVRSVAELAVLPRPRADCLHKPGRIGFLDYRSEPTAGCQAQRTLLH